MIALKLLLLLPYRSLRYSCKVNLMLLNRSSVLRGLARSLTTRTTASVSDWSHIYDGIYKFEDNSLGEDALDIRNQAL